MTSWRVAEINEVGVCRLPSGRLGLYPGDIDFRYATHTLNIGVELPAAIHLSVVIAESEEWGRACAAVFGEVVDGAMSESWRPVVGRKYYEEGEVLTLRTGFFGSPEAMTAAPILESEVPGVGQRDAWSLVDRGAAGGFLVLGAFAQYPIARTWVGVDSDDAFQAILVDLDLLPLNEVKASLQH